MPNTAYDLTSTAITINDTLTLSVPFTIDFWYYQNNCPEDYCYNEIYSNTGEGASNIITINHLTFGSEKLISPICTLLFVKLESHENKFAVPTLKWNHFTYEFGNNYAKSFVNGVLLNEDEGVPNIPFKFPKLTFGISNGKIDEFRIYNRLLTPEEKAILADQNRNITATESKLMPMDKTILKIYNLQSQEIAKETKGIQIRVFSDGSREKTFVE